MRKKILPKGLLSGRKHHKSTDPKTNIQTFQGKAFRWIDVESPQREDMEKLAAELGFHGLNVEDCLAKFELPKLDSYKDHFFAVLGVPPLEDSGDLRYAQLSMFVGSDYLVTVHQGDLQPLSEMARMCAEESRDSPLMKTPGFLVHGIVDMLVDDLLHMSRRIIANLEDMEDQVFDDMSSMAREISLLRRDINKLRRMVTPLKKFVDEISTNIERFEAGTGLELYFDDVIDHLAKVIETLEESRETMEIYKDTDFMLSTEKTNKVLAILTIIFTLAIPATVIGTLYGMNVALPGASLPESGDYTAFVGIVIASTVPAGIMFVYFKRLGWM